MSTFYGNCCAMWFVPSHSICWCNPKWCFVIVTIISIFVLNFFIKTSFVKLFDSCTSIAIMFYSISKNMDVIVVVLPFIVPFGMLMFYVNMTRALITILLIWLNDVSCNHDWTCSMFVAYVSIFISYISLLEFFLFRTTILYFLTFVVCV
jgi:hypothetical protein